ncbi:unnamed protein product, partial [marine sediment metagenome]
MADGGPPGLGGFIRITGSNDGEVWNGSQGGQLFDGLMGGAVFSETDAVMSKH